MVIAAGFGVGADMDAYLAATTLPTLLTMILTTSLAATFLPVFAEYREKSPGEAWRIAAAFMNLTALAGLVVAVAGMVFSENLSRLLAPGLAPGDLGTMAALMRWLLPGVMFAAVNQLLSGVYYSNGKFLAPMVIRITAPLLTIVSVLALGPSLNVYSLAIASLAAHALQTAILTAGLFGRSLGRSGIRYTLSLDWRHPAVRKILALMLPMMLGMCFYKLGPVFERWLASGMGTGAISVLGYARRLTGVLQPVLISGISISGFALMAGHVSRGDTAGMRALLKKSFHALLFVSVPLAVLLCGFGRPVIALMFERGAFTAQDTLETYRLFALYVLALPLTAVGTVVGQAFYAFRDTRIPTMAGILDFLLFAGLCLGLVAPLGLAAFPLGYIAGYAITTCMITVLLSRKTGFSVPRLLVRPLFTSLSAAAVALGAGLLLRTASPSPAWAMASLGTAFAAYLAIQKFVYRCREIDALLALLPRRFSPFRR
jgi:putative peptidoglycan lipid II flippase